MKRKFFSGFWHLFKTYWTSEEKWKARGLLALVVLFTLGGVVISVLLNQWYNTFYNALQEYNYAEFWPLIGQFTVLAFIYIAFAVYAIYLRQMLQIKWRTWMTNRYLERWMNAQVYYKMQVIEDDTDNPDQRISEDINQFVALTLQLAMGFLKQAAMLIAFVLILWNLSGILTVPIGSHEFTVYGYMVWLSLLYAIVGTFLTHRVGRKLISLNYDQQRFEADFRFSMMRVRENSESIAFYRGEKPEQIAFHTRFREVISNYWGLMRREKALTWFTSSYSQIAIIMPLLMAAPRYFSGAIQLGGLMQISSAFGNVQDSLSFFVNSYSSIAQWTAVVKRLTGFNQRMQVVEGLEAKTNMTCEGKRIAIEELQLKLPDGHDLLTDFSLELEAGERLIITGQSGAGKSTLMRAIAGIWPFCEGKIVLPDASSLFLPQRPYLPLGSLRQAICYPEPAECMATSDICRALEQCQLDKFIDRLDVVDDWSRILSLGEQQRLAFARILLVKPQWVFLDEASSAMDEPLEKYMYGLLQQCLPKMSVISVGHRSTLLMHHEKQLKLSGDGQWKLVLI
jgi:vitamin B12/bleomycin/antimicrobial peptide transport system ATP-binding/permease protein